MQGVASEMEVSSEAGDLAKVTNLLDKLEKEFASMREIVESCISSGIRANSSRVAGDSADARTTGTMP